MPKSNKNILNRTQTARFYKNSIRKTDYDIPYFSYKSAFLILGVTFFILWIVPIICVHFHIDYRFWTLLLTSLGSGFSVAFSQFFLEKSIGLCSRFWIVGILLSAFVGFLLFIVFYTGIIM